MIWSYLDGAQCGSHVETLAAGPSTDNLVLNQTKRNSKTSIVSF